MKVIPVNINDPLFDKFINFPWEIYPGKYKWVPPIKSSKKNELSPDHNPFFKHGEIQPFLCMDGDKILGRIIASIDNRLPEKDRGFFGYFESIDNEDVSQMLLEACEKWLLSKGKNVIHGPVDLNVFNGYRIQVDGFNTEPFLGEPRSPGYYKNLITSSGYSTYAQWSSYDLELDKINLLQSVFEKKIKPFADNEKDEYTIKGINLDNLKEELKLIHPIVNKTWNSNYGFVPLDFDEYYYLFETMRFFTKSNLFHKVLYKDEIIGFGFSYFDYAEGFSNVNGDGNEAIKILALEPSGAVMHSFGIVEEHRKSQLPYELHNLTMESLLGYNVQYIRAALIKEGKNFYNSMNFTPSRKYEVFEKKL